MKAVTAAEFRRFRVTYVVHCIVWVLATACSANAGASEPVRKCTGAWSAKGKYAYEPPGRIEAPNRKHAIIVADPGLSLVDDRGSAEAAIERHLNLTEILWAPDSRRFALTESEGGLVGTWHLYVYRIDSANRLTHLDLTEAIQLETRDFAKCFEGPESRNVGAASWLNRNELLVIAEVPPHSSCRNMGAITGFRVSANSGRVLERLPVKQLRKRYGNLLGCRLVPP